MAVPLKGFDSRKTGFSKFMFPEAENYVLMFAGCKPDPKDASQVIVMATIVEPVEMSGRMMEDKTSAKLDWKLAQMCRAAGVQAEGEDTTIEDVVKRLISKQVMASCVTGISAKGYKYNNWRYRSLGGAAVTPTPNPPVATVAPPAPVIQPPQKPIQGTVPF